MADSTLTQTVDLSAAADAIDHRAGGVQYELSGDLGGFLIDPSRTKVSVNFLDANGASLGTGEIKPVTALDRWFATGFMHRNVVGSVPVGARSAQVVVSFVDHNPVLGNYNNAYADNLSFKVDADGLAPAALTPPESKVGDLDHVFMVYMENKGVGQILGSPNAPYINALINQYGYASNYYGLTHPSDPNYYPIIGGSDFGFNFNCPSNCFPAGTPNLADRIEAAGMEWAGYMDGGGGYTSPTDRLPFLAFSDIYNDPERVATHLFDISELEQGLADPATAPNFVWFSADDETNMEGPTDFPVGIFNWALGFLNPAHQYNVAAGDEFLQGPLTTIINSPTWQDPDAAERHRRHVRRGLQQHHHRRRKRRQPHRDGGDPVTGRHRRRDARGSFRRRRPLQPLQPAPDHRRLPRPCAVDEQRQVRLPHERVLGSASGQRICEQSLGAMTSN